MKFNSKRIKAYLEKIEIPVLNDISLYKILQIYFQGITKGALASRAASASWSIFMSLFPFLIFFLLFISYLPYYEEIQDLIYDFLLEKLLPSNIFDIAKGYMNDRIRLVNNQLERPNPLLLIFSVLLFMFLSSNGIRSLIRGFKSVNNHEPLEFKGIKSFLMSIFIVLFFAVFVLVSLLLLYITEVILRFFEYSFPYNNIEAYRLIINIFNIILSFFIFFIGICFLYYFGRTTKLSFKATMPGALLTTLLFTLTTYFFGYYIANFTRYNVLYGSIGSVLIVMLWINISVIFTLIGYELNIALRKAKHSEKKDKNTSVKN